MASRPTTLAARKAAVTRPQQPVGADARLCNSCGATKPNSDFYKRSDQTHLRMAVCKECKKAYGRAYHARRRDEGTGFQETRRAYRLRSYYGITENDYETLLTCQGGRCAICHTGSNGSRAKFDIDHNHQTGKVRGLLCSHCNRALGFIRDQPETAISMAKYLRHGER